jgi:hypothetical protein
LSFSLSQLHKTGGAQVWRGVAAATVASGISVDLEFLFGYGLDFLPGKLALERGTLPWLAIGSRVCFQNYSLSQG